MKKLILIRGPICAGKSTTVKLLSELIDDCSVIDQDSIKRSIDGKKVSEWRDKIAFQTTLYLADQLMKKERTIIADIHSSKGYQYDEYKKLTGNNDYELFSFLLYPPLEVCLERNARRKIPDVAYQITDEEIKQYWENPSYVPEEHKFDTAKVSAGDIVNTIVMTIEKK